MRLFVVTRYERGDVVIVSAVGREHAKITAKQFLGGNSDEYIVEPLPDPNHPEIDHRGRVVWVITGRTLS